MNHCPVYQAVGGHAYGSVYPGPMGAVLTPSLIGVAQGGQLPNASTFCGRCEAVCPVRIPLPKMMRHWREREFERHLSPAAVRYGLGFWAFFAKRPALYRLGDRSRDARAASSSAAPRGVSPGCRFAGGWTRYRDLPAPQGATFQSRWRAKSGGVQVSAARRDPRQHPPLAGVTGAEAPRAHGGRRSAGASARRHRARARRRATRRRESRRSRPRPSARRRASSKSRRAADAPGRDRPLSCATAICPRRCAWARIPRLAGHALERDDAGDRPRRRRTGMISTPSAPPSRASPNRARWRWSPAPTIRRR